MSEVTVKHSGIVDGAGDGDRDESLARETDLCLGKKIMFLFFHMALILVWLTTLL